MVGSLLFLDRAVEVVEKLLLYICYMFIVAMFMLVVISVTQRFFGLNPIRSAIPVVEYLLLYIPLFVAPYLLRNKGHVYVELGMVIFPSGLPRLILEKLIYLVCLAISAAVLYGSIKLFSLAYEFKYVDIRGIDIPEYYGYLPFVISFSLCMYEFARYLFTSKSYYQRNSGKEFV